MRGDTPEPYFLSECTLTHLAELEKKGELKRCMVVDWNETTNVMLKLQERRKLEHGSH
jgi:hypothetical protein